MMVLNLLITSYNSDNSYNYILIMNLAKKHHYLAPRLAARRTTCSARSSAPCTPCWVSRPRNWRTSGAEVGEATGPWFGVVFFNDVLRHFYDVLYYTLGGLVWFIHFYKFTSRVFLCRGFFFMGWTHWSLRMAIFVHHPQKCILWFPGSSNRCSIFLDLALFPKKSVSSFCKLW